MKVPECFKGPLVDMTSWRYWLGVMAVGTLVALFFVKEPDTLHAQTGGEVWSCQLAGVAATSTKCKDAAPSGNTLWITSIVAGSSTSTAGAITIQQSVNGDCSSPTTVIPVLGVPANTAAPAVILFLTPVRVAAGQHLCTLGAATNTTNGVITGVYRPF